MQNLRFPCLTGRVGYFSLLKISLAEVIASRTKQRLCGRLMPWWHSPLRLCEAKQRTCCCREATQVRTKMLPCIYSFSTKDPSFLRHFRHAQDTSKPFACFVLQCLHGCLVIRFHHPGGASSPGVQSQTQFLHLAWGCNSFHSISCEMVRAWFLRIKAVGFVWLFVFLLTRRTQSVIGTWSRPSKTQDFTCSFFELLRPLWSELLSFTLLGHTTHSGYVLCNAVEHHPVIRVLMFRYVFKTQFHAWDFCLGRALPSKSLDLILGAKLFFNVRCS